MVWCRICGLTLLFLLLTSHPIHAYERDVHYDLTKYLARWAAFSEDEAEQVATADQEIDAKPEFNPLPNPNFCPELRKIAGLASAIVAIPVACKNDPEFQRMLAAQRAYHFVDSERLQALRESAFQGRNLKILGHYLHALQDTFAHSLMDYADLPPLDKLVANLGRLPDEKVIGHFLYGHSLDKTYERPDLAEQMARYVYAELVRFKGSVNRWNEIDAAVARFVREQDSQKKLAHLASNQREVCRRLRNRSGGLLGESKPCPEAGNEEKKAAADKLAAAFKNRYGVREMVMCDMLSVNPFLFEGKMIGIQATFDSMATRDTGRFWSRNAKSPSGYCRIDVSGIPQGIFGTTEQEVVLAAEVIGRGVAYPQLQFSGVHICKERDCADFFGPASMR